MSKANKPKKPKTIPEQEAAFVMASGDRFHSIIVSDTVRFELHPDTETVITFFVIRRASGKFDIVNVLKTFKKGKCVTRSVQTKGKISPERIEAETVAISEGFGNSIEKQTGLKMRWHTLDLSGVMDAKEQVLRIKAWNRVGVHSPFLDISADLPPSICLN